MRLIDADALKRVYQEVLCPHVSCADCSFLMDDRYCRFETMISEAHTIDAVPVVRCEKCKHGRKMIGNSYHYCVPHNTKMYADDFCSYGERKEGAD